MTAITSSLPLSLPLSGAWPQQRPAAPSAELFGPPALVASSFERCAAIGLCRDSAPKLIAMPPDQLAEFMAANGPLRDEAAQLFWDLHRYLADPEVLLVITDRMGRIVDLFTVDESLAAVGECAGLRPGVRIGEEECGTNAVALCLMTQQPAVIAGAQHYLHFFQEWMCFAVPILRQGQFHGCVALSTRHDAGIHEKLALVYALARSLGQRSASSPPPIALTKRQIQVLSLYASGVTYKQIAFKLELRSIKTVQEHLEAVRVKLNASSHRECIRIAIEHRLIQNCR